MAQRKSKRTLASQKRSARGSDTAAGTTVSGPSHPAVNSTALSDHATEQQTLALSMPFNEAKSSEYRAATVPVEGQHRPMPSATTAAGTLSEVNVSSKTGAATLEPQSLDGSLASKRVNSTDQVLTTNQGVSIANNQDSLKAGLRGPTLLEDFILREKITPLRP